MFHNREEAAERLSRALKKYHNEDVIILAVPRGGVPIGKKVAEALHFPMDITLIKKVGHPVNKEYAIGAVGLNTEFFNETDKMVTRDYVREETEKVRDKLRERYKKYMGNKDPLDLTHKTVIIVDDGIATGSTLLATVQLARKKGASKVVVAAPVGPFSAVKKLQEVADEVICLEMPPDFRAVGQFYDHFEEVNDDEVVSMLQD